MDKIEIGAQFRQVLDFVNETGKLIFLTGKAGTGKTTLLKFIRQNTFKQMAVVAPTGVAAINAGGSTIHSFFQFPFSVYLPVLKENGELDVAASNLPAGKYNSQRLAIFRNLELLVIDEISMVRADLLDQIDLTLRRTRKKWHLPFGGVQVLMIGDMYQLPPVIQQEEWKLLGGIYPGPYFFESIVIRQNPPVYIELEKIYRQSDEKFIRLLNKVRNNELDLQSLDELNAHYKQNISQADYRNNITLTTHNRKADEINSRNLEDLPGNVYKFKCKVEGLFSDKNYPADEQLSLKTGTRVMFIKNNPEKNYYNGKIGTASYVDDKAIRVTCDEDKDEIEVGLETWQNIAYEVDKKTKHIDEEVVGTFQQYPLRLAWAITIHKSQGLTFDRLIIDAAESFSAGQVYVALSRCRSLQGLTLSSRISRNSLMNDHTIIGFSSSKQHHEQVLDIFDVARRSYIKTVLINLFDLSEQLQIRQDLGGQLQLHRQRLNNEGIEWLKVLFEKTDNLNEVSSKFKNQLSGLIDAASAIENDLPLQSRLKQASAYFGAEIKKCLDLLKDCSLRTESKEAATGFNELLAPLAESLFLKHALIENCREGFVFSNFIKTKLKLVYPDFKLNIYVSAKNTRVTAEVKHPMLYRELLLERDAICNDEHKPIYLVAKNATLIELANYLPDKPGHLLQITGFGEARAEAYGSRFLEIIREYMIEHDLVSEMNSKSPKKSKKAKKDKIQTANEPKVSTKEQTFRLFRQGHNLEDIARQRGFALSTVQGHLVSYVASGEVDLNELVSPEKQRLILNAMGSFKDEAGLGSIKSKLPPDISFAEIRYVMAGKSKVQAE